MTYKTKVLNEILSHIDMYLCKAFVLLLFCFNKALGCSPGWLAHGSSCYHFSHDKEDWAEAVIICRILGGQLVEIEDAAENHYLKAQTSLLKLQFWIGLNDLQEEGTWVWANSKTPVTYIDWATNEPSNSRNNENCAIMEPSYNYQWNDGQCQNVVNYICEKPAEYETIYFIRYNLSSRKAKFLALRRFVLSITSFVLLTRCVISTKNVKNNVCKREYVEPTKVFPYIK